MAVRPPNIDILRLEYPLGPLILHRVIVERVEPGTETGHRGLPLPAGGGELGVLDDVEGPEPVQVLVDAGAHVPRADHLEYADVG